MDFIPLKTRKFVPGKDKDQLFHLLDDYLPKLKDKDIVVITSKIVAISQGRCVKISDPKKALKLKFKLIKKEAQYYNPKNPNSLAVKGGVLTPYAGIDRSNANGSYILWPKNPFGEAKNIWQYLTKKLKLKKLGVIIADSFCLPFRWGHMGISLGFFGFNPLYSYARQKDIFGRPLKRHSQNLVDALAALAVVHMGEGSEQTPLLIIRGFNKLKFSAKTHLKEFFVNRQDDLYAPLLSVFKQRRVRNL